MFPPNSQRLIALAGLLNAKVRPDRPSCQVSQRLNSRKSPTISTRCGAVDLACFVIADVSSRLTLLIAQNL